VETSFNATKASEALIVSVGNIVFLLSITASIDPKYLITFIGVFSEAARSKDIDNCVPAIFFYSSSVSSTGEYNGFGCPFTVSIWNTFKVAGS
jgi:hypothetical protein